MNDASSRPILTVYRRAACHLCDDAELLLRDELAIRARAGHPPITVRKVDIGGQPELEARFGRRIPVFAIGELEAELVTSQRQVRELLDRALTRPGT
jgi:hypothetical protein